jgi:hypothetical protein
MVYCEQARPQNQNRMELNASQPASKPAKSHEFVLGGLVYKPIEN